MLPGEHICNLPALLYISLGQDVWWAFFQLARCTYSLLGRCYWPSACYSRRSIVRDNVDSGFRFIQVSGNGFDHKVLGYGSLILPTLGRLLMNCPGGLFSGTVAAVHSALGEMTDTSNRDFAIPIFGLMWPFGAIVGFVS